MSTQRAKIIPWGPRGDGKIGVSCPAWVGIHPNNIGGFELGFFRSQVVVLWSKIAPPIPRVITYFEHDE